MTKRQYKFFQRKKESKHKLRIIFSIDTSGFEDAIDGIRRRFKILGLR